MPRTEMHLDGDRPLLLFGGPYGNLQATEALLAEAVRLGVPPEQIICTGDLVAYCGDPAATIARVRDSGVAVVMGNCDEQLAIGADDCGCGFAPGSSCERLSAAWFAYADGEVDGAQRRWLAGLPRRIDVTLGAWRFAVVHGGASTINEFIFATSPAAAKMASLELCGSDGMVDGIIGGHCGLPFTECIGGRLWHNPGVIGMPANDGTPRVWFSLMTPRADGLAIEHRGLDYDHDGAACAMQRAGLPDDYRRALRTGLWPSLSVLPERERQVQGMPLRPSRLVWRRRPTTGAVLWPEALRSGRPRAEPVLVGEDEVAS